MFGGFCCGGRLKVNTTRFAFLIYLRLRFRETLIPPSLIVFEHGRADSLPCSAIRPKTRSPLHTSNLCNSAIPSQNVHWLGNIWRRRSTTSRSPSVDVCACSSSRYRTYDNLSNSDLGIASSDCIVIGFRRSHSMH